MGLLKIQGGSQGTMSFQSARRERSRRDMVSLLYMKNRFMFQSARRERSRRDCDPSNRQSRKNLLLRFREQVESLCP